jgi:hypothetical protein
MVSGAETAPARSNASGDHTGAPPSRLLLGCGVLAGPLYLAVGILQGFLRPGFDFARHPLSVLANGPGGWVQTANFVITGLLVLAAAVGFQRVLGPKSRAVSWFLGAYGGSMLVASVFHADPMDGFPIGTPVGPPTSISPSGIVHFAAGGLGFVSLGISCLFAARAMSHRDSRSLARLSLLSGLIVLVGFFSVAIPNASPVLGIWIAVVVGWAWLAILSRHLSRVG